MGNLFKDSMYHEMTVFEIVLNNLCDSLNRRQLQVWYKALFRWHRTSGEGTKLKEQYENELPNIPQMAKCYQKITIMTLSEYHKL